MRSGLRLVFAAAGLVCAGSLGAAEPETSLTPLEIKDAIVVEEVALPTPGEFFAAINKLDRPNWSQLMATSGSLSTTNRPQAALNLGTRVADGFIAVEAQDGQQVKNVGKDIIEISKGLGVSQSILARGNSIGDFAESNDWSALKEELEATENEVKQQMAAQKDDEMVILVTIGAWLRGVQTASKAVAANYLPETARLLRQPAIVEILVARVDALPDRIKKDELVAKVQGGLLEIKAAVSPAMPPSVETVNALLQTATQLVDSIGGAPAASPAK